MNDFPVFFNIFYFACVTLPLRCSATRSTTRMFSNLPPPCRSFAGPEHINRFVAQDARCYYICEFIKLERSQPTESSTLPVADPHTCNVSLSGAKNLISRNKIFSNNIDGENNRITIYWCMFYYAIMKAIQCNTLCHL